MDIQVNKDIYNGLKAYNTSNSTTNYGNTVLEVAPKNKVYPYTLIQVIRDVANTNYNTCFGRVSSKGYRVDIYAQDKGKILRKDVADVISQQVDYFLSEIGLQRVSYNAIDLENEGTTYHIIMTYSADLDEYRRKFI